MLYDRHLLSTSFIRFLRQKYGNELGFVGWVYASTVAPEITVTY